MTKLINDFLKENDLIIITGEDFRVYGRAKYDENEKDFKFISDEEYNKDLNNPKSKEFLVYNCHEISISYIIENFKNVSIDIYRQTPESKIGNKIFFIDK
jgi:hypothetical protein